MIAPYSLPDRSISSDRTVFCARQIQNKRSYFILSHIHPDHMAVLNFWATKTRLHDRTLYPHVLTFSLSLSKVHLHFNPPSTLAPSALLRLTKVTVPFRLNMSFSFFQWELQDLLIFYSLIRLLLLLFFLRVYVMMFLLCNYTMQGTWTFYDYKLSE